MISPLAAAVAAYGLPGAPPLPHSALDDAAFDALVADCEHHRVLGLFGCAVRDGAFPVTDAQRSRIETTWSGWLAHSVRMERLVLHASAVLDAEGIRSIVLKGLALAHTVYPASEQRVFGDVDLLVEPHDFTRAATTLASNLGAVRALPELRRGFDDRFGKEILLRVGTAELDLHRMFVDGPYGLMMRLGDLWESPESFRLAGRDLLVLGGAPRAVHAAYAAALGDWPPILAPARDLAQILATSGVTVDDMVALARRWRAEAVVETACMRAAETLGVSVSPALAQTTRPPRSRRDAGYLASYQGFGRGYRRHLRGAAAVRGLGARLRYTTAIVFPSREHLAARGVGRLDFARTARSRLRSPSD